MPTLKPSVVRAIQGPLEARRGTVERGKAVQAQIYQVFGRVAMQGAGEATFDASFPIWFLDPPQVSFSGELAGNPTLVAGQFPTISVMVRTWTTQRRAGATYYTGATFIVVVKGPADMSLVAHWQCEGAGLTNPLLSDSALDQSL